MSGWLLPPGHVAPREQPNLLREYRDAVRTAALAWVGRGELAGKNNRGPDIDALLAISGVGQRDKNGHSLGGPWCGVGCSAMLVLGARAVDLSAPPFAVHAGAKRLVRNAGEWGSYVVAPRGWTVLGGGTFTGEVDPAALAGALLAAWHRGVTRETAWSGHVEIVLGYEAETDTLITIAPNVVPGPAQRALLGVAGIVVAPGQALWHVRRHEAGGWRRKLFAIATVAA